MANRNPKPTKKIRAIGYIRMSTDQQEDSPERQRAEILALAEREGCTVIDWYEDHGLTGTESKNRPAFQRMMADAQTGKFDAILLSEQSRFSREGIFEVFEHWGSLRATGVVLITCQRGRVNFDDLGGIISALVDAHSANDESKKISCRAVSGKAQKLRTGKAMARRAFAFDREMIDESGAVVKRVHFAETFSKPKGWQSRLVPTADVGALDALRWMFAACRDGMPLNQISHELNKRGVSTGRNGHRNEGAFCAGTVKRILRNPMYVGTMRYGFQPRGKFNRLDQHGGPFVLENSHEPLIDVHTFALVQKQLDLNGGQWPARGVYLFRGLLHCGHCGNKMYGHYRSELRQPAYCCYGYNRTFESLSRHNRGHHVTIRADWIDEVLVAFLRKEFAHPDMKRELQAAIAADLSAAKDTDGHHAARLREMDQLIGRVEQALFDGIVNAPENVAAVERRLSQLRSDREELAAIMQTRNHITRLTPEASAALSVLDELIDQPEQWNRNKMRVAMGDILEYAEIKREIVEGDAPSTQRHRKGKPINTAMKFRRYEGRFVFKPGIFSVDVLEFSDGDLRPGWKLNRAIEFVRGQGGRMVTTREVAEAIGSHLTVANRMMRKGAVLGIIDRVGGQRTGGWMVKDQKTEKAKKPVALATG